MSKWDEFWLSIFGSAAIAGVAMPVLYGFGHPVNYFVVWLVVFFAWWGIVLIDFDFDW